MKLREVKAAANELVEMPQNIKALLGISIACLIIASAALVVVSIRSK